MLFWYLWELWEWGLPSCCLILCSASFLEKYLSLRPSGAVCFFIGLLLFIIKSKEFFFPKRAKI